MCVSPRGIPASDIHPFKCEIGSESEKNLNYVFFKYEVLIMSKFLLAKKVGEVKNL